MALASDGPPLCPKCESVTSPTWDYCASCGNRLDALDHTDPEDLQRAFDEADTITEAAERFDVGYQAVREAMIDHGIYTPRTYRS